MSTWVEIDLGAITRNLALVRERVAPAELLAVVKDNAYGHGLEPVVRTLAEAGVSRFGALDPATALRVRALVPGASIFAWLLDAQDDLDALADAGIELGVTDEGALERAAAASVPVGVHLKLDSGLSRAGVRPERWSSFVARAAELEKAGRLRVVGVWTHISEASDIEDSASISRFEVAVAQAREAGLDPRVRHLAASAAAFARDDARFDQVRVGAFLYGIAPGGGIGPAELGLEPAMTLRSTVVSVGGGVASIDYGGAAGLLADAAGAVSATAHGARLPIIAVRDTHAVVSTAGTDLRVGDAVTLFGSGASGEQTLQEWADAMGTIGEELATRVHPSIERRYSDGSR